MKLPAVCIPMLLAVCFLSVTCHCSRPSPEEPRTAAVPHPLVRDDDEQPRFQFQHHRDNADDETTATRPAAVVVVVEGEGPERRAGGAAPSASAKTPSDKDDDQQGGGVDVMIRWWSKHQKTKAMMRPSGLQLRSRLLARRVLAAGAPPAVEVEGAAADSAAKPSCRSSDVHISCGSPPRD